MGFNVLETPSSALAKLGYPDLRSYVYEKRTEPERPKLHRGRHHRKLTPLRPVSRRAKWLREQRGQQRQLYFNGAGDLCVVPR